MQFGTKLALGLLALFVLVAGAAYAGIDSDKKVKLGEPAVDFTLNDPDGKEHSLSDFKGKTVVLVWTNPECPYVVPHCQSRTLDAIDAKFDDEKVAILQIDSTDTGSVERTKKTAEKYELEVVTLHDFDGKVGRAYGAKTTPHCFVIDAKGKLVYEGALDNAPRGQISGDDEEKVNYVEAALNDVLAGRAPAIPSTKPYGCGVKYAEK